MIFMKKAIDVEKLIEVNIQRELLISILIEGTIIQSIHCFHEENL